MILLLHIYVCFAYLHDHWGHMMVIWQLLHHVMMVCPKFLEEHTASLRLHSNWIKYMGKWPRQICIWMWVCPIVYGSSALCTPLQTIAKRVDKSAKNLHALNPLQMTIRPLWDCHTTLAFLFFILNTFMCTSVVLSTYRMKMIDFAPRVVFSSLQTIKDNPSLISPCIYSTPGNMATCILGRHVASRPQLMNTVISVPTGKVSHGGAQHWHGPTR